MFGDAVHVSDVRSLLRVGVDAHIYQVPQLVKGQGGQVKREMMKQLMMLYYQHVNFKRKKHPAGCSNTAAKPGGNGDLIGFWSDESTLTRAHTCTPPGATPPTPRDISYTRSKTQQLIGAERQDYCSWDSQCHH